MMQAPTIALTPLTIADDSRSHWLFGTLLGGLFLYTTLSLWQNLFYGTAILAFDKPFTFYPYAYPCRSRMEEVSLILPVISVMLRTAIGVWGYLRLRRPVARRWRSVLAHFAFSTWFIEIVPLLGFLFNLVTGLEWRGPFAGLTAESFSVTRELFGIPLVLPLLFCLIGFVLLVDLNRRPHNRMVSNAWLSYAINTVVVLFPIGLGYMLWLGYVGPLIMRALNAPA